jgi:hypothetical protein
LSDFGIPIHFVKLRSSIMYVLNGTGHALGVVRREETCEEESVLEGSVKPGKMGRGNGGQAGGGGGKGAKRELKNGETHDWSVHV